MQLDRMGDKLATKIMANIEASKGKPLARLIFALGIIHVGSEVAELLARTYNDVQEMAAATDEELAEIIGIGPKIAASVGSYFRVESNQIVIEKLRAAGVSMKQDQTFINAGTRPLNGKTFVITGTLLSFSRKESESRIKGLGGKVTSSVTKNTDYVVVGESPGSKLDVAKRLGTNILDESSFIELLSNLLVEAGT